jgi:signal peptide peptidase SppA
MTEYRRIMAAAREQPWALEPEAFAALRDFLLAKAAGEEPPGRAAVIEALEARGDRRPAAELRAEPTADGVENTLVVPVFGVIAHRMNLFTEISGGTSTEALGKTLRAAGADRTVDRIVLDVNSPGGGVYGVPELAQIVREVAAAKPVIAVVNATMASAAYWIGAAATEIVITPSGQAGSIGVFAVHENRAKQLEQAGIEVEVVAFGRYKAEDLNVRPLSKSAREYLQRQVDLYGQMFVRDVANGRGVSTETVMADYGEGRALGAEAALEAGLVDRIATLDAVLGERVTAPRPASARAQAPARQAAEAPAPALAAAPGPGEDFARRLARHRSLTRPAAES